MMIKIRKAVEADSEKIWALMKALAVFERYIDSFAITPEIVRESGSDTASLQTNQMDSRTLE